MLIAGGGTLGRYTAKELLSKDCEVDVICLEDNISDNSNLRYYKANADLKYLTEFLKDNYYDGIVNFIHYTSVDAYKPVHKLLCSKTDQLIFLSSYRVYADLQHPITETAPMLADVVKDDEEFLATVVNGAEGKLILNPAREKTISHIEKSISTTGSGTHKRTKVDHTVYVNYTYKNQEYTNVRYNIYTSNMKEGGTIQAKINPNNPREFYYSSSNIIIGTIITIISVIVMVTFIFGIKKKS